MSSTRQHNRSTLLTGSTQGPRGPTCINPIRTLLPHTYHQVESRRRLPKAIYEYVASGSEDEQTLWENRQGFKRLLIWPRVLKDVSTVDTRCDLSSIESAYKQHYYPNHHHFCHLTSAIDCTTYGSTHSLSLFGGTQRASMPIFISPAGVHCLVDKEGEAATARAARRAGEILFLMCPSRTPGCLSFDAPQIIP